MRIYFLRIFGLVFLLNLVNFDLSLAQEEQLHDPNSAVNKVSNNMLVENAAEKASLKNRVIVLEETNLDNVSESKDKLHELNEFILPEHELVNSKDDNSNAPEEIVTFTSVVTSRNISIHKGTGVTQIRPILHNGQIAVQKEVPASTPYVISNRTTGYVGPSEVIDIDDEVIKEVDNTEDMSKLLGEELPTMLVNGERQEITASMEEIFEDQNDEMHSIDKKSDKDKMGIIDEWMKQQENEDLSVEIFDIVQAVPELNVITNEGKLTDSSTVVVASTLDKSTDVEIMQKTVQWNIEHKNLATSKGSMEVPNVATMEVARNKSTSNNLHDTKVILEHTETNLNQLDENTSTNVLQDDSTIKSTTAKTDIATMILSNISIDEPTTTQEPTSDLNSATSVPQEYSSTAFIVAGTFTSADAKRITEIMSTSTEDDNLKVVALKDELEVVSHRGVDKEFMSPPTKSTPEEMGSGIFTSTIQDEIEESPKYKKTTSNQQINDDVQVELINVMDQIKKEIQEQKEELEYFEGLMKGTTLIPDPFTRKPSERLKSKVEEIEDEVPEPVEYLKGVQLESTTEYIDGTVEFTTKLVLTGDMDRVNGEELMIEAPLDTNQKNSNKIDNVNVVESTTEFIALVKELNVVPLDQGQLDQANKDINIDVIIDRDTEIKITSSKNEAYNEKVFSTEMDSYVESTSREMVNGLTTRTPPNPLEYHHHRTSDESVLPVTTVPIHVVTPEIAIGVATRTLPNIFVFHHQTLDQTVLSSTTSTPIVTTEIVPPTRSTSITELVKQVLGANDNQKTISKDSKDIFDDVSHIDKDYGSEDTFTKPVNSIEVLEGVSIDLQSQIPAAVPSIEAIDYGSSEEDFASFTKDLSNPRHFPRKLKNGFNENFDESQKVPVLLKVPAGDNPTTTISYRSVNLNDAASRSVLQDVIAQAVMNGINAMKTKMDQVRQRIIKPLTRDYDENMEGDVLVRNKQLTPLQHILEVRDDPIEDLSYDSAETDREVKEIEEDRELVMIHRDLYFDEDMLSVNFSMGLTVNNMDYLIPENVLLQANNSDSTVFLQLTWSSSNATSSNPNSLIFQLKKGENSLQIDGLALDMQLTSADGTVEHLQFQRNRMNIVEWTEGEFEIKFGPGNVIHIVYMDLVLNEKTVKDGVNSATFQQNLTSGTALLIVAVAFGSAVTAFAIGYLIYLKCRRKANVFKVDLP